MLGHLRSTTEFERLRREGGYWRGTRCNVNAVRRAGPPGASNGVCAGVRVGYITSRRIGCAVRRNRARRLMREAFRSLAPRLEPGWDMVVIARPAIGEPGVRMQDVRDDLQWILTKAQLLRPD